MPTLNSIKNHIKAITNIQKVTTSMKMIAATMYMKADKKLRNIKGLREAVKTFYKLNPVMVVEGAGQCVVALTSDRGLCGGIHWRICREAGLVVKKRDGLVLVGNRSKQIFSAGNLAMMVLMDAVGVGHRPPSFRMASHLAIRIPSSFFPLGVVFYAEPKGIATYKVRSSPLHTPSVHEPVLAFKYELEDLESYLEFSTACVFFCALWEGFAAELGARVASMSSASKNAARMRKRLMVLFNQQRQAKVTTEMIDIVTGAEDLRNKAMMKKHNRNRMLREERAINIELYGVPTLPFSTCPFKVF